MKLLVIDAIRYTDDDVGRNPSSCSIAAPADMNVPSHHSPHEIVGHWCSFAIAPTFATIASASSVESSNGVWLTARR